MADGVFAIVKIYDIERILDVLNSQFDTIKFTCELENEGKLEFVDLEIQRNANKIEFGV